MLAGRRPSAAVQEALAPPAPALTGPLYLCWWRLDGRPCGLLATAWPGSMSSGGCCQVSAHRTTSGHRRAFQVRLDRRRTESGLPYWVWQALPRLFPEEFQRPCRLSAPSASSTSEARRQAARPADRHCPARGRRGRARLVQLRRLPYGHLRAGRRTARATSLPAMPSNNLDLYRFIRFLLDAGADERLRRTG